jgi:hypothetical protein
MGFLGNPLKKIGGALSKLPGAKTLNKPINRALGKTPGLKGVPQKLGMAGPAKKSPIAPTPSAMPNLMQGGMQAAGNAGIVGGPKPMPQMEMPEAQPGMMEQQAPAPMPMQQAPTEMMGLQGGGDLTAALPQQQQMPQVNPQMNDMMAKMRQRNTGVNGGNLARYRSQMSGIGPSFMG